jgi:sigma-B regulation protein RsbU (phosphoserine phosphatase)
MCIMRSTDLPVARALIADDQPDVIEALRLLLKGAGYQTRAVTSPADVIEVLKTDHFDLLLMDLNYTRDTTSGREGLDLLSRVQALDSTLPIVVMTAWGSIELTVEAMRRGVRDFILKPWENARLLDVLREQIEFGYEVRKERILKAEVDARARDNVRQIEEARDIQRRLLPKEIPQIRGCDISFAWQPAEVVSGDYFDVLKLDDDRVALCIADVSGKGLPAALLMSNVQAAVKAFASADTSPAELCARVNRVISGNIADDKFITLFYCLIDCRAGKLTYTNAGHNPAILVRKDATVVWLEKGGAVLGPFPEGGYEQGEAEIRPGDRVLLFTDGITEARNESGEEFGEDRLIRLAVENRHLDAQEMQAIVIKAVAHYAGDSFHDDATLVALSVR